MFYCNINKKISTYLNLKRVLYKMLSKEDYIELFLYREIFRVDIVLSILFYLQRHRISFESYSTKVGVSYFHIRKTIDENKFCLTQRDITKILQFSNSMRINI